MHTAACMQLTANTALVSSCAHLFSLFDAARHIWVAAEVDLAARDAAKLPAMQFRGFRCT